MDHQPSGLKFAAIGHQDNWANVLRFVNAIRDLKALNGLSLQAVKEVYGFIPPRPLFDVQMQSVKTGTCEGIYLETFIVPDELDAAHLRINLNKVKDACRRAAAMQIPVVALGGFTSIALESSGYHLSQIEDTFFTTGNTLTAAFIAKGVQKACDFWNVPLQKSRLLIIGSTGDIGSACTRFFAGRTKALLLCARQASPLQQQAQSLTAGGVMTMASTNVNDLLPQADIVICVASSLLANCNLSLLPAHALICDAGYPKNLHLTVADENRRVFFGGLGVVKGGYRFTPDYASEIYHFPVAHAVHGCLLEAIVLAMEGTPKALSTGRGNITVPAMEAILQTAAAHGVAPAPLFNANTVWEQDHKTTGHEQNKRRAGTTV